MRRMNTDETREAETRDLDTRHLNQHEAYMIRLRVPWCGMLDHKGIFQAAALRAVSVSYDGSRSPLT